MLAECRCAESVWSAECRQSAECKLVLRGPEEANNVRQGSTALASISKQHWLILALVRLWVACHAGVRVGSARRGLLRAERAGGKGVLARLPPSGGAPGQVSISNFIVGDGLVSVVPTLCSILYIHARYKDTSIHRKVMHADGPVDRRGQDAQVKNTMYSPFPASPPNLSFGRPFLPDRAMAPIVLP